MIDSFYFMGFRANYSFRGLWMPELAVFAPSCKRHLVHFLFGLVGFILLLCLATLFGREGRADEGNSRGAPNIIVIMADDMGYGDLSSYGHPVIKTPHLDSLAAEGLRFTSFYAAAATCTSSRAGLMTGRYAVRSGMHKVLFPNSERGLPVSEITVAEALRDNGYQTAMVGKWHLGDRSPFLPTENGFEEYFGLLYSNDMVAPWVTTELAEVDEPLPPLRFTRNETPDALVTDQGELTRTYTREAIERLQDFKSDVPFFLYVAYAMPHLPVAAPDEFRGKSRGGLYGDAVETIDWSVGQILEALQAQGLADNTLVFFTSDNGPWLNLPERMVVGGVERWHAGSKGPLRGAKGSTYEGGFRVPAIIRWPGLIESGGVSSDPVSALDIYATLVSAGGGQLPKDRKVDGQDLTQFMAGQQEQAPDQPFFFFNNKKLEAVRNRQWKLRISCFEDTNVWREGCEQPVAELYDLDQDVAESFNIADRYPEQVKRLKTMLIEFAQETGADLPFKISE